VVFTLLMSLLGFPLDIIVMMTKVYHQRTSNTGLTIKFHLLKVGRQVLPSNSLQPLESSSDSGSDSVGLDTGSVDFLEGFVGLGKFCCDFWDIGLEV
jgi:hypothetical protein